MQNEAYDEMSRREREMEQEAHSVAPPSFSQDIHCGQPNVGEGQPVRIMGEITPYDGSLKVDWLKDGQPIVIEAPVQSEWSARLLLKFALQAKQQRQACRGPEADWEVTTTEARFFSKLVD
ncbi:unnamed protein product [Dibothriocephalus latus]|uniref:Uncharacterized protein n=1 Tax=Dibothriocephalus latus TaxID=60516 RepID=A0A3P7NQ93_DIBLA|nr:unnamed protein product [Dibothriocephalus latus]